MRTSGSTSWCYTFRPRLAKTRRGQFFVSSLLAVSNDAKKAMGREIRRWRINRRSDQHLEDLAKTYNPVLQGWINYYGRFYKSMLYPLFRRLNEHLARCAARKYKRLHHHFARAVKWLQRVARRDPSLIAHWRLGLMP